MTSEEMQIVSENELSLEPMAQSAIELQERVTIDTQIATAHKYPRSISSFKNNAVAMATMDEATAESCIYRRPVGRGADGKQTFAEGLSIRMAEIVCACYGNIRYQSRVIESNERFVKVQAICHDLERNVAVSVEKTESTVNKYGKPYDERMRIVISQAAQAKALRDAVFKVVPRALAKPIENAVRSLLFGDGRSMNTRRDAVKQWVKKIGIDENRVWKALGINGADELTDQTLEMLTGIRTAISDGDATIDSAFPELPKASTEKKDEDIAEGEEKLKALLAEKKVKFTIEDVKTMFAMKTWVWNPNDVIKNIDKIITMIEG